MFMKSYMKYTEEKMKESKDVKYLHNISLSLFEYQYKAVCGVIEM